MKICTDCKPNKFNYCNNLKKELKDKEDIQNKIWIGFTIFMFIVGIGSGYY